MGTPREPDTGVSGNGEKLQAGVTEKRRKTGADLAPVFLLFSVTPANSISYASRHPCVRFPGLGALRRLNSALPGGGADGGGGLSWLVWADLWQAAEKLLNTMCSGYPVQSNPLYSSPPPVRWRPLPIHKKSTRNIRALFF